MKPEVRWTHIPFAYWMDRVPKNVARLLDVGTGRGVIGAMSKIFLGIEADGIEIWKPYAEFCKKNKLYHAVISENALTALKRMPSKSYDVIVCFETIEHWPKEEAWQVLEEMERVGKLVFLSSVNHYYNQPHYDGNPWQHHHSLITSREIEARGYRVRGFGKRKDLFGSVFRTVLRHFSDGWFAWKTL